MINLQPVAARFLCAVYDVPAYVAYEELVHVAYEGIAYVTYHAMQSVMYLREFARCKLYCNLSRRVLYLNACRTRNTRDFVRHVLTTRSARHILSPS